MEQTKKSKTRSPEYPVIGLKEAVKKINSIYDKDHQNPLQRKTIAMHMGYKGLSGQSLSVLSALLKYGLLEGRANDCKVSDLALQIIAHKPGSPERLNAIKEAASKPGLFKILDERFPLDKVSDEAIRSFLIISKYIPSAATNAIRSYRETKEFIQDESSNFADIGNPIVNPHILLPESKEQVSSSGAICTPSECAASEIGKRRSTIFALAEGDVTILFPEELSPESVGDLADYLEIFMKKAKREAGIS